MLNIIHRLKPGMLPALFFLTSASVLAQSLMISPGHWQEGMAVGGRNSAARCMFLKFPGSGSPTLCG